MHRVFLISRSLGIGQYFCNTFLCFSAICRGVFLMRAKPFITSGTCRVCWYGLIAVKSLLPAIRKRVSLVVTYWQPLSCFIFLRLLLDILLNLFCIFPCLYPRATYTPPYQAYVPILSASGYTCNIPNIPLRQNSFTKLLFLYQEHLVIHATFLCANPLPNLLFLYLAHPVIHVISSAPES